MADVRELSRRFDFALRAARKSIQGLQRRIERLEEWVARREREAEEDDVLEKRIRRPRPGGGKR